MSELMIQLDNVEAVSINEEIKIEVFSDIKDNIEFKFIEGHEKVWSPIQDFSTNNICRWKPNKIGKHLIMVQGKFEGSVKPYDIVEKIELEVKDNIKLIKNVVCSNRKVNVGEKVMLLVEGTEDVLLYRFWIMGKNDWEILRDYGTESTFVYTANESGNKEFLVECKKVNSVNNVDDFIRAKIEVKGVDKVEIINFSSLSDRFIVNEELIFRVDINNESPSSLLYKFYKVNENGKISCIQEYSSRNTISFKEKEEGTYKLLCLVRHMFSNVDYEDRAMITYTVKPYEKIQIKSFNSDLKSPQSAGTTVNLESIVVGGREILYRYIVEGPVPEDSGYLRTSKYQWKPSEEGSYSITLLVKDISSNSDFEDRKTISFEVDERGEKPVRLIEVKSSKGRRTLIGHNINITAKAEGGSKILYKFIVYKNGVQKEELDYGKGNWIDFTPEEPGEYEIEVRAKDYYSTREYDSNSSVFIQCSEFLPAKIDHIISNCKEINLINETVEIEAVMENTLNTLVRFVTKIDGYEVEDTGFIKEKSIKLTPRCPGKYTFTIYAKNIKSTEDYDTKKELSIHIRDFIPVNSTKVTLNKDEIKVGEEITFEVSSVGGKDVCYEFYLMKNNNWILVQPYSKKNFYTFIPFAQGEFKLLVLSKSYYKNINYEDYDRLDFSVK